MTSTASPHRDTAPVSVVVLTHNRRHELERTLNRLSALPDRVPIIVVDNASTDGSAEIVASAYPDIQLVRASSNMGAAGRNLGARLVRTPFVAFCDDDTWWAPGSLSQAAALLGQHPLLAALNAHILVGPDHRDDPACIAMAASPLDPVPGIGPRLTSFMAGACIIRTDVFRQHGGYRKDFFIGGEETLLAMDILNTGQDIAYAPALTVHHWPSTVRDTMLRRQLTVRNAIWTAWLRLPRNLAWQRTTVALQPIRDRDERRNIIVRTLAGMPRILADRRVLRRDTCTLLEAVWHQQTPQQA